MKLGFAILSHQRPGKFFEKLLLKLNEFPNKKIIIHHDFSIAPFNEDLNKRFDIELTDRSCKTGWAKMGIVDATFECLKKLTDTDWIILLSTSDYPIKKIDTIINFLKNTQYNAFIEGIAIEDNKNKLELLNWVYDGVFRKTILKIPSFSKNGQFKWRHIKVKRKTYSFNDNTKLFFGSQWFMIDKTIANFLRNINIENNQIVKFLSNSDVCKDETIIQTLIYNQPEFKISGINYRYINWDNAKDWHPNPLSEQHWEGIRNSKALFARKFDWNESHALIDLIDKELEN